jgi:hypothetical protein
VVTNDYTFPLQVKRDTNGSTVDLGYHYDLLQYAILMVVSNASVTFVPGTSVATYGGNYAVGIDVCSGGSLYCIANATNQNYIGRYNTVQEQSNTNWEGTGGEACVLTGTSGSVNFSFTDWSALAGTEQLYVAGGNDSPVSFQNCQFYNGIINGTSQTLSSTNCLYQRVNMTLDDYYVAGIAETFYNNLFWNGELTYTHEPGSYSSGTWTFRDNLFDQTIFTNLQPSSIDVCLSNAYVTNFGTLSSDNATVVLTNSPAFQTNTLGDYYYPSTLTNLIHKGSRLASAAGLYHYTVTTDNDIEGTNTVSIGFHYVACCPNDLPLISNTNGIPNYLADANGDGIADDGETPWSDAPVITNQPSSQTVADGSAATFSVTVTGATPLSYQWCFIATNTSVTNTITGATNSSYTISDVQAGNAGSYFVVVTNVFGSATSDDAVLTDNPAAPTFVYLPVSQTVVEGDTVTFSVRAVGTEPIGYQWQEYNTASNEFIPLLGQTNSQLVDSYMQSGDAGTYAVVITNSVGTNSFTNAVLTTASFQGSTIYDSPVIQVFGPRQDYTFQASETYYIAFNLLSMSSNVDLYGTTTIQGGSVIKFDYDELPSLDVYGVTKIPLAATLGSSGSTAGYTEIVHSTSVCNRIFRDF